MGADTSTARRRWWIIAGVVGAVLAVAGVAAFVLLRESTTPVGVDEAVADFRASESTSAMRPTRTSEVTTASPPTSASATSIDVPTSGATTSTTTTVVAGSALPAPGVYRYTTSGGEELGALDGRNHHYPAESTITVTHEGCGAVHRWRPLRERWDATHVCPSDAGAELRWFRSRHQFFGIDDERDFVCAPGSLLYPAAPRPGFEWSADCSAGDVQLDRTGTVVGTRETIVAGTTVTVLDISLHDVVTGASDGTTERTLTVVPDTGLIVELTVDVDVRNDSPIGAVHYQEFYELRLTSLTPVR